MLDTDSAIVSFGTIIQIKKGVTIRRPLDGYRDRVAAWHLVINSPTRVEISAIIYTIIISKTEENFTLQLPYPFKRKFQVHVFMEFAVHLFWKSTTFPTLFTDLKADDLKQ